jgi:hypothetical protein
LRALADGEIRRRALSSATTRELVPVAVKSEDDQYYYMMTGRSEARGTTGIGEVISREEFLRYKHMSGLLRDIGVAHSALSAAVRVQDPTLVTTLEEAFDSAAQRARAALEYLSVNGGPELDPQLIPLATRLIDAGTGPGNDFDQLKARMAMALVEQRLISSSDQILATLEAEIAGLVEDVNRSIVSAAERSEQAAADGQTTVLVVGVIGILAILLAAAFLGSRKRHP